MWESFVELDNIRLNFNKEGIWLINFALAFVMFGIALDIKTKHFKLIFNKPRPIIAGVISQFILLPALTFLVVYLIRPSQTIALGMILVAACPGGNISNFISSLSKANVALSVTLTAFATVLSLVMTPLNFMFWGKLLAQTSDVLRPIEIPIFETLKTIVIILGIPLVCGIYISNYYPNFKSKILKPIKIASIITQVSDFAITS